MDSKPKSIFFQLKTWIVVSIIVFISCGAGMIFREEKNFTIIGRMTTDLGVFSGYGSIPEYERVLQKVVLSISVYEKSLDLQEDIFLALPEYTDIHLLMPKNQREKVEAWMRNKSYADRVYITDFGEQCKDNACVHLLFRDYPKLQPWDQGNYVCCGEPGSSWAQDLFEVMSDGKGTYILASSCAHRYFSSIGPQREKFLVPDNECLFALKTDDTNVVRLPLAFHGGNLLFDSVNGQSIAFCGGDVIRMTQAVSRSLSAQTIPVEGIEAVIKESFNVDEVIFISADMVQPTLMYHLDQAMILLGNQNVGVAQIIYDDANLSSKEQQEVEEAETFLSKLRVLLLAKGYTIIPIEMTAHNLRQYQHYVNAIPYRDKHTDEKKILMPVFKNAQSQEDKRIIAMNGTRLSQLGYTVTHVMTEAHTQKGGLHCLLNVVE